MIHEPFIACCAHHDEPFIVCCTHHDEPFIACCTHHYEPFIACCTHLEPNNISCITQHIKPQNTTLTCCMLIVPCLTVMQYTSVHSTSRIRFEHVTHCSSHITHQYISLTHQYITHTDIRFEHVTHCTPIPLTHKKRMPLRRELRRLGG